MISVEVFIGWNWDISTNTVCIVNRNWNYVNPKGRNLTKVQVKNNIYYYEVSSKPNVDIIGITVSMRKQHIFETIFTSDDFLKIQDTIGKGFGFREREFSMRVNAYFSTWIKTRPHATPNYGTGKSKFEINDYRQKHSSWKTGLYTRKVGKIRSISKVFFIIF